MGLKTPLYAKHVEAGARIVDFGGWDMPLHYGSQVEEHHSVRRGAGMFDVSHMTIVDVEGERSLEFLRFLLANDAAKLREPGAALYSCMLNDAGGVVDDLIVYLLGTARYRLVGMLQRETRTLRGSRNTQLHSQSPWRNDPSLR